jgi:hypothetical protein
MMNFPEPPQELENLAAENFYAYIVTKAVNYLDTSPEEYRQGDAFGLPSIEWEEKEGPEIYEILNRGCKMVLEYTGLTKEKPFTQLGISGFYYLMSLFHFKAVSRKTLMSSDGLFVDQITFEHIVTQNKSILFNLTEI